MPPSTLNYWVQIGLVAPSLRQPQGRRVEYWWSVEDVVVVRSFRALRDAGASLQRLRRARRQLAQWGVAPSSARVLWDGRELLLATDGDALTSLLSQPGQGMFRVAVLPLGEWHAEVTALAEPVDLAAFRKERRSRAAQQRARRQPFQRLASS